MHGVIFQRTETKLKHENLTKKLHDQEQTITRTVLYKHSCNCNNDLENSSMTLKPEKSVGYHYIVFKEFMWVNLVLFFIG